MLKKLKLNEKTRKRLVLGLGTIGLIAFVILAAGVDSLSLLPGQRFIVPTNQVAPLPGSHQGDWNWLMNLIIAVGLGLMIISTIFAIASPELRKQLFQNIFVMVIVATALIAYFIFKGQTKEEELLSPTPQSVVPVEGPKGEDTIGEEVVAQMIEAPPGVSSWLRWVISLGVMTLLVGGGYLIWLKQEKPVEELEEIARNALLDLQAGRDWEDTVIQCYSKMTQVILRQRSLTRSAAMTPMEFAQMLVKFGFQQEPVERLTRLFEKARYSGHQSETDEARDALQALTDILQGIGEPA